MSLTSGDFRSYDDDRQVVRFTMLNAGVEVPCAVSTDAMDRIGGKSRGGPIAREQQFLQLRGQIEDRAQLKFDASNWKACRPASFCGASIFRWCNN